MKAIECVRYVDQKLSISKTYYLLTAHIPRKLPTNEVEFEALKKLFIKVYSLEDALPVWITVAGQITSTPAHKIRKSHASIVNAAKRLRINAIAHNQKMLAMTELENRLRIASEKLVDELKNSNPTDPDLPAGSSNVLQGAFNDQRDLQSV